VRRATGDVPRATCHVPRATCHVRRATCKRATGASPATCWVCTWHAPCQLRRWVDRCYILRRCRYFSPPGASIRLLLDPLKMRLHELDGRGLRVLTAVEQTSQFGFIQEAARAGLFQVVLHLHQGSQRVAKELNDTRRLVPCKSLRDVATGRPCSIAKAIAESEIARYLLLAADRVDFSTDSIGELPTAKISRVCNGHATQIARCVPRETLNKSSISRPSEANTG